MYSRNLDSDVGRIQERPAENYMVTAREKECLVRKAKIDTSI